MKKFLWILSISSMLILANCGGGSKEAKELLQKLLTVIGIPPSAVMHICQDDNNNDFCDSVELKAITNSDEVWQSDATVVAKVTETSEGRYLLETETPCVPILLELQDSDVTYDSGEFTLKFSGVEYGVSEKELSILEAMIDAGYLNTSSVSSIRNLSQEVDQNKFYALLYQDLKTNLNTLRATGLTKTQAMVGTLKEMAEELMSFGVSGTLPDRINGCNGGAECVDIALEELSKQLLIDENEANVIYEAQKDNNGEMIVREVSCEEPNIIDLAEYFPNTSTNNSLLQKWSWSDETTRINEKVSINNNILTFEYTTENITVTINSDSINITDSANIQQTLKRHVSIGDTIGNYYLYPMEGWYVSQPTCTLDGIQQNFSHGGYEYYGDIIREKCTHRYSSDAADVVYVYRQKNIGRIAHIDDDCIIDSVHKDNNECTPSQYLYVYLE